MALGHLLNGKRQADAPGAIMRAQAYEAFSALVFAGRRRRIYGGIVRLSEAGPGDRVLDVGCGPGYLTALAAEAVAPGGRAEGVDPSAPMIEQARRTRGSDTCSFRLGKAESLDVADESFDVVVTSLAVHHVPEQNRSRAFAEMFRVLRPGGRLVVADFRPPQGRLGRLVIGGLAGPEMRDNPVDRIGPMVRDAGFENLADGVLRPFLYYVRAGKPAGR